MSKVQGWPPIDVRVFYVLQQCWYSFWWVGESFANVSGLCFAVSTVEHSSTSFPAHWADILYQTNVSSIQKQSCQTGSHTSSQGTIVACAWFRGSLRQRCDGVFCDIHQPDGVCVSYQGRVLVKLMWLVSSSLTRECTHDFWKNIHSLKILQWVLRRHLPSPQLCWTRKFLLNSGHALCSPSCLWWWQCLGITFAVYKVWSLLSNVRVFYVLQQC